MFVIPINEGSTVPLPAAEVGRASAFRALLVGVPGDLENVEVHFATPPNASGTPQGDSVHLGEGTLRIVPSSLNVDAAAIPIVPDDMYLRNPMTGLWHKLTCTIEDGDMLPLISKEGITK